MPSVLKPLVLLTPFLSVNLFLVFAGRSLAATPLVQFDVAYTVACHDVTTPELSRKEPESKLIEAVVEISTHLIQGDESDLRDVRFEIKDPDRNFVIVRYLPTTTLTSDTMDGIIVVDEQRIEGELVVDYRTGDGSIGAKGRTSGAKSSRVVSKKLAPKSLLVSSGTVERSHGVAFRLRYTPQDTLQKARQFVCLLKVPKSFRADCLELTCASNGLSRGVISAFDAETTVGQATFLLAIYMDGDSEAQKAAAEFARRQESLFEEIAKCKADLQRQAEQHDWRLDAEKRLWDVEKSFFTYLIRSSAESFSRDQLIGPLLSPLLTKMRKSDAGNPTITLSDVLKTKIDQFESAKQALRRLNAISK